MLNYKEFLLERKKLETEKQLALIEKFKEYENNINAYFSFKSINNLTQNKNLHDVTPKGLYCYSFKTAFARLDLEKGISVIPFSFHENSISIFEVSSSIKLITGKNYAESDFESDKENLLEKYKDKIENPDRLIKDTFARYYNERIWNIIKEIASLYPNPSEKWRDIILDLGYDGFADTFGSGIVSPKEKYLNVIVNKLDINFIEKVIL